MSVTKKRILDDETFKESMETQALLLAGIAKAIKGSGDLTDITDVAEFARYLGAGFGTNLCSIGKQFQVPKEASLTIGVSNVEGSTLVATINEDVYMAAIGHADEHVYEATYDGAVWHKEDGENVILSDYGITTSGTPLEGDKIIITVYANNVAWDLVQYNPSEVVYPYDTSTKGDYGMLAAHKIQSYGSIPYCPSQLMYFAATQALPAGTYKFTLYKARYGGGSEYDGSYKFTTTQAIPLYGGFRIGGLGGWQSSYAAADVTSKKVSTYGAKFSASASCTAADRSKHIRCNIIESDISITVCADGDTYDYDLGTFTAQRADYYSEDDSTSGLGGKRNRVEQQCYGDNRFSKSLMLIYANSDAAAGSGDGLGNWFYYRSVFDLPPSASVCNYPGYMHGYGKDFIDSIQTVRVKCALPAYYSSDNTVSSELVECKFFLMSQQEVSGGKQTSITEGAKLAYYDMYPNASDRRKQYGSSYQWWFTRSAYAYNSNIVMDVDSDGGVNYDGGANNSGGFVPACVIKKSS